MYNDTDIATTEDFEGVTIGVVAMNKKSFSKPMKNILLRMAVNEYVRVVVFTDNTILNNPVEKWPYCDALIAFYSKGFPLDKAIKYVELKQPKMVVNDLDKQYSLMDRRKVYEILESHGIDVPPYVVLDRNDDESPDIVEIDDDTIEVKGHTFHKPFVEKPISAEDHNIYIYFPSDYGGGSQRLFRKVLNRSSMYSTESTVRKDGSYIYEEFMPTDGSDVKVYTVGPDYAHAEARKSPALDGRVDRDDQGKEKRFPVILSAHEKLIARKVCLAFKQTVCGFDLLRANGNSYVCDVNGFSFVKTSEKYYDDCSQILLETILSKVAPHYIPSIAPSVEYLAPAVPVPILTSSNTQLELRCVIGIIRHADRTPKQKMKMIVKHVDFFTLFNELGGYKKGQLKLKKPKDLQRVLDIARKLLDNAKREESELEEKIHKLKTVLEMYGHFSGINRKVQFKLLQKDINGTPLSTPALLLILKWGGEVTAAGQAHAEELGKAFRRMYPGGVGEYSSLPGSGFLRLHSTYRHDLKVYASDEGRVQMTAAAFTKGLLDLEGNLASILVQLVKRDQNATNMLDTSNDATEGLSKVKQTLHQYIQGSEDFNQDSIYKLAPTMSRPLLDATNAVNNPQKACEHVYHLVSQLLEELRGVSQQQTHRVLYQGESLDLIIIRWSKLLKDFRLKSGKFDISKIPDIYDCIKYDLQHNSELNLQCGLHLYKSVIHLADIVIPQEYGITVNEKMTISKKICNLLLHNIRANLRHTSSNADPDFLHRLDPEKSSGVISPNRSVRTRLYFTSESHVHCLINILKYGDLMSDSKWKGSVEKLENIPELNYLSQVVFMVFENISQPADSEGRYVVETYVSSGVKSRELLLKGETVPQLSPTVNTPRKLSINHPVISSKKYRFLVRHKSEPKSLQLLGESSPDMKCCQTSEADVVSRDDDCLLHTSSESDIQINSRNRQKESSDEELLVKESSDSFHKSSIEYQGNYNGSLSLVSILEPLVPICTVQLPDMVSFLANLCEEPEKSLDLSINLKSPSS